MRISNRSKILLCTFSIFSSMSFAFADEKADFVEPGRFGLGISMTDDGPQFGPQYFSENFEVILAVDGSFITNPNFNQPQQGDNGWKARIGKRWNISHGDYLVLGAAGYVPFFGHDSLGNSTWGTYKVGPYVGIERVFPGTPILLSAFIEPVNFISSVQPDNAGNPGRLNTLQFFQSGGFGISYLF